MEWEMRSFAVEMRVFGDDKPKIEGYAAIFEQLSEELWGFREKIRKGAFTNVIRDDVRALFNHDANFVLGRNRAGTLKLEEDDKGLRIEIDPPNTQAARDLLESIRRGDVNQMSFMFTTKTDEWKKEDDGTITRTLVELERLLDVSVVTFPAYPQTSASARCLEEVRKFTTEGMEGDGKSGKVKTGDSGAVEGSESDEPTPGSRAETQDIAGLRNGGERSGVGVDACADIQSGREAGGPVLVALKRRWVDLLEKI